MMGGKIAQDWVFFFFLYIVPLMIDGKIAHKLSFE